MTYIVVLYSSRKEDISPSEFTEAWNRHNEMLFQVTKPHEPIECTRYFPARKDSDLSKRIPATLARYEPTAPVVLLGLPEDITWDGMAVFHFRDELHFQQFWTLMTDGDAGAAVMDGETKFSDPEKTKLVVIGETAVTRSSQGSHQGQNEVLHPV